MTIVSKRAREKADAVPEDQNSEHARRCLVSGAMRPRTEMVRFVIGPEDEVVPDLAENLPGRGLWVTATVEAVRQAVKSNVFAKAARQTAKPAVTLADDVKELLRRRCLNFLGLAKGAGIAVLGETQTEAALRAGKLALYVHAPDATRVLDSMQSVETCDLFTRSEIGAAFGFDQIAYAGVVPHKLTEKLKMEINRFRSMTGEAIEERR